MTDIRTIEPGKYNKLLAEEIKKSGDFEFPEWARLVKTGSNKRRPTTNDDFWYYRAASILRQIYIQEVVGVEKLRSRYGGRKNRGVKPAHFVKSGGKIIRKILQQAEAVGYVEKVKGKVNGRKLTKLGKDFLEGIK